MPFDPGDPIYACFRAVNPLAVGFTTNTARVYRDVINTPGEWNVGDTIKVQDPTYLMFGYHDSGLTDGIIITDSVGNVIGSTTTGQGTTEATVTLTATAPNGETLDVCYRVGVAATYVSMCQDRKNDQINCHDATLDSTPTFQQVFNVPHPLLGGGAVFRTPCTLDGLSIQANPPT